MPENHGINELGEFDHLKRSMGEARLKSLRVALRLAWCLIAAALVAGGLSLEHLLMSAALRAKQAELAAITQLRVNQILGWRAEVIAGAGEIVSDPLFMEAAELWDASVATEAIEAALRNRLLIAARHQRAEVMALLTLDERLLVSEEINLHLDDGTKALATRALDRDAVELGEIYQCMQCKALHLELAAPLHAASGDALGAVLLRLDPRDSLFALLNFWPGSSLSAETLLVQRDQSDAVLLNSVRQTGAGLECLRVPVSESGDVAVRAVTNAQGALEGLDYRGVPVIAQVAAVPETGWFVVSKIDREEVTAAVRVQSVLVFLVTALGILLSLVSVFGVFRYRQGHLYRKLYRAELDHSRAQETYRATLYSIGEGVITTDAWGNVRTMNRAAEMLTGTPEETARGRPLAEAYSTRLALEGGQPLQSIEQVLRAGARDRISRNVELQVRNGGTRHVAETATPILGQEGEVSGIVLVFRDQTAEVEAQQAVRESEARLRLALSAANQGTFDLDLQTGLRKVGREYTEPAGASPVVETETLEDWARSLHPDDFERVTSAYREHLAGNLPEYRAEYRRKGAGGGWVWILALGRVVEWDSRGNPLRMLGTHTDISARKETEAALMAEKERAQRYLDVAGVILLALDREGRVSLLNRKGCELLGLKDPQILGQSWFERHVPPLGRKNLYEAFLRMISEGTPENLEEESPILQSQGAEVIIAWRHTLLRDAAGAVIGRLSSGEDVTQRKLVEQERDQLSHVVAQSPIVVTIVDTEGSIVYVNHRFTEVTGYTPDEVIGQNPRILKSSERSPEEYRQLWETVSKGGIWRGEFHNRRKDGQLFWEYATISPLRNAAQEITHYVAFKEDMGERKLLEAQLHQAQKMDSIGRLAGGVAHDFNNMLNVILGHADLAASSLGFAHPAYENLQEIIKAAERSADLTRQLLAFARKQAVDPQVFSLNDHIAQLEKMLRRLIGENISFEWEPGENLRLIKMDPSQVDQVLVNLAVNARDAIAGSGRLIVQTSNQSIDDTYVATHHGAQPGEYVLLTVSDTGSGMDAEVLAHLFEPFFSTKPAGKGTGLGLATVYGIIKQNGGHISAYSNPGRGSSFKILLPAVPADAGEVAAMEAGGALAVLHGHETILVVEDERLILDLCTRILETYGYNVLAASGPEEALRISAAFERSIDLLVSDVVMPKMSGKELREKLYPQRKSMKCLFMSGYTADVMFHHGIIDKHVNFIAKPFTSAALLRKVRECLDD